MFRVFGILSENFSSVFLLKESNALGAKRRLLRTSGSAEPAGELHRRVLTTQIAIKNWNAFLTLAGYEVATASVSEKCHNYVELFSVPRNRQILRKYLGRGMPRPYVNGLSRPKSYRDDK